MSPKHRIQQLRRRIMAQAFEPVQIPEEAVSEKVMAEGIQLAEVQEEIRSLEQQQAYARQVVERCDGALQVARNWQEKLIKREMAKRAEEEAAKKAEEASLLSTAGLEPAELGGES